GGAPKKKHRRGGGEEEAGGNAGAEKEVRRQADDAFQVATSDEVAADDPLRTSSKQHAVREDARGFPNALERAEDVQEVSAITLLAGRDAIVLEALPRVVLGIKVSLRFQRWPFSGIREDVSGGVWSGCEQLQQTTPLFDHLVGAQPCAQASRPCCGRRRAASQCHAAGASVSAGWARLPMVHSF